MSVCLGQPLPPFGWRLFLPPGPPAFPSSLLLLELESKDGSSSRYEMVVVFGHSPGFVPLWFMSARDCCVSNEESLQKELDVTQGGAPAEMAGLRGAKGLQCKLCLM